MPHKQVLHLTESEDLQVSAAGSVRLVNAIFKIRSNKLRKHIDVNTT